MPATRYKWGGTTWADLGNGKAYSRWGGGWFPCKTIRAKVGAVGTGSWTDGGFTGQPAGPSVPWVEAWDYNNIIFKWNAGAGGTPIAYYEYVLTNEGGGWLVHSTTTATSVMIGINWDSRYRFYVQAVGINGVATGWSNGDGSTVYGHPGIGHPRQDSYGYVWHSTPWQSEVQWNYRHRNELFGVYVTSDIHLTSITWANLRTSDSVVSIGTNRTVYLYLDNSDQSPINYYIAGAPQILSSNAYAWWTIGLDNFGNNAYWGIVPREVGWAVPGGPGYILFADSVQLFGDRFYQQWEIVSTIPEAGNYWW